MVMMTKNELDGVFIIFRGLNKNRILRQHFYCPYNSTLCLTQKMMFSMIIFFINHVCVNHLKGEGVVL